MVKLIETHWVYLKKIFFVDSCFLDAVFSMSTVPNSEVLLESEGEGDFGKINRKTKFSAYVLI